MSIDPMTAALIISAVRDTIITISAKSSGEDPEEFKKKVDALQVKSDDLEKWLKGAK